MALSILNNIPSLVAQNQLTMTSASMQTTLFRLSSGSRINSGADDAAGLAIADGLRGNVTALTQSSRNATDGIGKLQVADGALSQVGNLLNRAITLATEAATGTVNDTQRIALNTEFKSIKDEITRIGSQTTYNGDQIFNSSATAVDKNTLVGSATIANPATNFATAGQTLMLTDSDTGQSFLYTTTTSTNVNDLITQINTSTAINAHASVVNGKLQIVDNNGNGSLMVAGTPNIAEVGGVAAKTLQDPNQFVSASAPGTGTLAAGTFTITDTDTGKTYSFITNGSSHTVTDLINDINSNNKVNAKATLDTNSKLVITDTNGNGSLSVSQTGITQLGAMARPNLTGSATTDIYLSDGTSVGGGSIQVSIGNLSDSNIGFGSNPVTLGGSDLLTQDNAKAALNLINSAIANVAADRGSLGAAINRLTAASSVITNQVQNLSAAEDGIRSADIAKEVANLTKYTILNQTGISALAQANQMQQSVLKLLQ